MTNSKQTSDSKNLRKETTKRFIDVVTNTSKLKFLAIENALKLYEGAWRDYKNGARSWPFPKLNKLILLARRKKLISEEQAEELTNLCRREGRPIDYAEEEYKIDCSGFFLSDISQTVDLIATQVKQLEGRLLYGNPDLETIHYVTSTLDVLDPINQIINNLNSLKEAEQKRLRKKYGNTDYKIIDPKPLRQRSIDAVGWSFRWWTRPTPTPDEIEANVQRNQEI